MVDEEISEEYFKTVQTLDNEINAAYEDKATLESIAIDKGTCLNACNDDYNHPVEIYAGNGENGKYMLYTEKDYSTVGKVDTTIIAIGSLPDQLENEEGGAQLFSKSNSNFAYARYHSNSYFPNSGEVRTVVSTAFGGYEVSTNDRQTYKKLTQSITNEIKNAKVEKVSFEELQNSFNNKLEAKTQE